MSEWLQNWEGLESWSTSTDLWILVVAVIVLVAFIFAWRSKL